MELNKYIEQTLLKPDATKEQIKALCIEALEYNFVGVCIAPYFVKYANNILENSAVKIVTVVGFPMGYQSITSKVEETKKALEDGANEIDMVINISALKSKEYNHVKDGIEGIATLCRLRSKPIKVIIETCLLTEDEIIKACEICADIEVDYVKTSTGVNCEGATIENVKLMRKILPKKIKIKAAGGIRDYKFAKELIKAGADRLGTSSGVKIVSE
ncbi:MAG: deoxyribose-phosphate aldolase [Bacteroidota bacterium]|nr:deoxyribose-phosphate aldolase [Bacteroidota bacterium]